MAKRIEFKLGEDDYLELGIAALDKGEYEKAIGYFRTACSLTESSGSYTELGIAYAKMNELDASDACLYKAMSRATSDEEEDAALWQLCLNAAAVGEEDVASYYLRCLGEEDNFATAGIGSPEKEKFKIADKSAVEYAKEMLRQAGEAFTEERFNDALDCIDAMGDAPEPYYTMGRRMRTVCYFAKGDLDKVVSVCEEIEKTSPDPENKSTLAAAYCLQGREADADRILDEIMFSDDTPDYVTLKMLHIFIERERDADILKITEKLVKHPMLWHNCQMFRSQALYNLGRHKEAVREMTRVDNVFGEFSAAHYYLKLYAQSPERVSYGNEIPREIGVELAHNVTTTVLSGDLAGLQRALSYDADFNRALRWMLDHAPDFVACPLLIRLADIRSKAVEKLFRDRLISVRLSFDQMVILIDYLVGNGLSVQFDTATQGRFKIVDFRLPACFSVLPTKLQSAVYHAACDIVFTDEDPSLYIERLCDIVEKLVVAGAHGEPVWATRNGRRIARLRSEDTMIGVLLSEVYRDDPDPDEDAMQRYDLSPRTFYKYRAIFFGDSPKEDDGGDDNED